jgi:Dolichyl-phosphate-mannose-protein mannosyltransferase
MPDTATLSAPELRTPYVPILMLCAVFCGALVLTLGLRLPGFVHHDTAEVVMWGHSGWAAGFWKHPPFLPWLTRLSAYLLPMGWVSLALLTALNMTVCTWAVWQVAVMAADRGEPELGWPASILLACIPFASVMAIKLNHNTILISLWPLTTLAFLRALERPTALRGGLFGLAAAAAVLAKYYSLLLLGACLAASLVTLARAARFYRAPAPYVAVAVFLLAMAPHLAWMIERSATSLTYAFGSSTGPSGTIRRGTAVAASFAIQAPLMLVPMAIVTGLLWKFGRQSNEPASPHRFEREILILAALPFVLTIALTLAFNMRGAVAWAMPVFVCLPALLAARIGTLTQSALRTAAIAGAAVLAVTALAGQIVVRTAVARGAEGTSDPRREIAAAATELWRAATGTPLALVGGDQRLTSTAVVFSPDHPQGWPSFSIGHAPWIDPLTAARSGFIGICRTADKGCIASAEQHSGGRAQRCVIRRRVEYLGAVGPWVEAVLILVPPAVSAGAGVPVGCPAE